MKNITLLIMLICLMVLSTTVYAVQSDTCPTLVEEAIDAANENCSALSRNEVCYGYRNVSALFFDVVDTKTFAQPTDIVPVTDVRRLETLPADPETSEVGIALMKLQAMLPNTLPGQSVLFIMIGDVQIENAVNPESAAAPADPIAVTVATTADLRSGAAETYNAVASVEAGTELGADGTGVDGTWVRVIVDEYPLWIAADALEDSDNIEELPVVSGGSYGAMQAFTMTSGVGASECEEAPATLLVQGTETAEITLNVNGVDVAIGSTVVFEAPSEDTLELSVLDGSARLSDNQVILSGFKARLEQPRALFRSESEGAADEAAAPPPAPGWLPTEAIQEADLVRFDAFERLNPAILNYKIVPPRAAEIRERVNEGYLDIQNNFQERRADVPLNFEAKIQERLQSGERPGIIIPQNRIRDRLQEQRDTGLEDNLNLRDQLPGLRENLPDINQPPSPPDGGANTPERDQPPPPDDVDDAPERDQPSDRGDSRPGG